jgi:hypothetical protein
MIISLDAKRISFSNNQNSFMIKALQKEIEGSYLNIKKNIYGK